MSEIVFLPSSVALIDKYCELYLLCFPNATHLKHSYLTWLYEKNPTGHVVGADAWCEGQLIGQVAAIPTSFLLDGVETKGVIAMNVAVHPNYQGRHLFKRLGLKMCEYASEQGYRFAIGVANAAATPGWIRQMGFQLVSPLQAKVGFGVISYTSARYFEKKWDRGTLLWRCANPINPVRIAEDNDSISFFASAGKPMMNAYSMLPKSIIGQDLSGFASASILDKSSLRVFLGFCHRDEGIYIDIPERFKPSPLNFIYKNLINSDDRLSADLCRFDFLGFDAF